MENLKSGLRILKELNYILTKKQKKKTIVVFVVIAIESYLELLGVAAVLPFIQAILTPDDLLKNKYVHIAVEIFNIQTNTQLLLVVGIGLIFVYILKNIYILYSYYVQYSYSARIRKEISVNLLNSYLSRPYEFFLEANSAEIQRGCSDDIAGVYYIISYIFSFLSEVLNLILIGIFIIYTDWKVATATLILLLLILALLMFIFKPKLKKLGRKRIQACTMENKVVFQSIMGIKEILVKRRKDFFVKNYESAAEVGRKCQSAYDIMNNSPNRIIEGICVSVLIGIICFRLVFEGNVVEFVPKMATFAMAAFKVFPSVGKITSRMTGIIYYRPQLSSVYQNIVEANQYKNDQNTMIYDKNIKGTDKIVFRKTLSLENISLKYKNRDRAVLENINVQIHKGEMVAFIGASGAGKTTLADIALGVLKPQSGRVYMDEIDIQTIPDEWAQIVDYVPQSVYLLDDTIRNNITFGVEEEEINDIKVWSALENAQLKEFVMDLPNGLNTVVGERGIKFSGGQKQRIAIARALYNEPQILILDEATAALDNETEAAVIESIETLRGKITIIIIAHRLSTIRNCDKIYEVKDGKVIIRNKNDVIKGQG